MEKTKNRKKEKIDTAGAEKIKRWTSLREKISELWDAKLNPVQEINAQRTK